MVAATGTILPMPARSTTTYIHPLTAYRRRHALTMEQLGALSDPAIHKSMISRIESGEKRPSSRMASVLIEICGGEVSYDELFRAIPKDTLRRSSGTRPAGIDGRSFQRGTSHG